MKVSHILLGLLGLFLVFCNSQKPDRIILATSANMQFAMEELVTSFTEESGINCEVIISSSGKLTAQIMEGAPYDMFISADMKYPEALYNKGLTTDIPKIYAYGQIVLWSINEDIEPTVSTLTSEDVDRIAIPNPLIAPYGNAAIQALNNLDIYELVESKLVFGESVAQTNQFIMSGAAEIGFTAKSVVLSPTIKGTGSWSDIDPDIYSPIAQGAVIIKSSKHIVESEKFLDFLISEKGKKILHKFGYSVN